MCVCVCVCVCVGGGGGVGGWGGVGGGGWVFFFLLVLRFLCIFTYDLMPLLLGLPALCSVCQSVCAIIGVTVNNILL